MENQLTQMSPEMLIAAGIGFLVGAILFWIIASMMRPSNTTHDSLQKSYDDLKKEYKAYREKVDGHFSKTTVAFDNLTQNYQELLKHLSTGAETLMDAKSLQREREKRQGKAVTLTYLSTAEKKENKTAEKKPVPKAVKPNATSAPAEKAVKTNPESKTQDSSSAPAKAAPPKDRQSAEVLTEKPAPTGAAEPKKATKASAAAEKKPDATDSLDAVKRHIRDKKA